MSWHIVFIAASKATALAHLDTLTVEQPHAMAGINLVRPIVEALPEQLGLGVSVKTFGHIGQAADGGYSNATVEVTHVPFVSDPAT